MSEVEVAALHAVDILLKTLTDLGKDKLVVDSLALVPYQEPVEG